MFDAIGFTFIRRLLKTSKWSEVFACVKCSTLQKQGLCSEIFQDFRKCLLVVTPALFTKSCVILDFSTTALNYTGSDD